MFRRLFFGGVIFFSVVSSALAANLRDVVINEVAWMGTVADANDEWIELRNNTDAELDLTGFSLRTEDGTPAINLSGVISARGYFLLERTDDTTIADVSADQLYTGALGNAGEVLILRDAENNELDRVEAWYAGDNATKKTMERSDPTTSGADSTNWNTNDGVIITGTDAQGNPILGTPRAQNSGFDEGDDGDGGGGDGDGDSLAPTTTASPVAGVFLETQIITLSSNEPTTIYYTLDGSEPTTESAVYVAPLTISTDTSLKFFAVDTTGNVETAQTATYTFAVVKINEFVSNPASGAEWVEFYNSSAVPVSLAGATLADNTGVIHTFAGGDVISAHAYFTLELSNKLNNGGDTLILRAPGNTELDRLAYGDYDDGDVSNNFSTPGVGESLARRPDGVGNFFVVTTPTRNSANPVAPTLANSVVIKINEVDFKNSSADRVELLIVDDGNAGAGVDLGGFYFSDDGNFKTLADGTLVHTGDLLVLNFNSANPDELVATDGVLHIFTSHSGLVGTDEQIVLRDGASTIEDEVAWATENPSETEVNELNTLVSAGAWIGLAFSASAVPNNYTIARNLDEADSDARSDFLLAHPTLGAMNTFPNTPPVALITTQSASACSLSINLDGATSSDADSDALAFAWEFGDGATDYSENPGYHTFASSGTYAVTLMVTDILGASHFVTEHFTVATCGGGGSSSTILTPSEPILESLPAWKVKLLITEVAFNSEQDFAEVFVADDGADGAGVELGGFYFDDGKRVKTIPRGTLAHTGEYLVLYFQSNLPDDLSARAGVLELHTEKDGLVKTDKSLALRDSHGTIESALVWSNHDGAWSRGVESVVMNLVYGGAWDSANEATALDSSTIERGVSLARKIDKGRGARDEGRDSKPLPTSITNTIYSDTNSAGDFFATPFPTPGAENGVPPLTARDVKILLTRVAFKNPDGDAVEFVCVDCGAGTNLAGFFLKFGTTTIFHFPENLTWQTGERGVIQNTTLTIYHADGTLKTTLPIPTNTNTTLALTGTDGLLTLKDYADTTTDFVCFTDRTAPPSREYDLTLAELIQLEKRAREGEWNAPETTSCLDSRLVERGGSIRRKITNDQFSIFNEGVARFALNADFHYLDTNSVADWEIVASTKKLKDITPMISNDIFISEILPNPSGVDAGVEWFELANLGTTPVELFAWSLSAGRAHFVFEESTLLAPGEYRAFPGVLTLPNAGGTLTLIDPFKKTLREVAYPALAEGEANSFDGSAWHATATPTPNAENIVWKILSPKVDLDRDGLSDDEERALGTDPERYDTDGDGLPDYFEVSRGLDPLTPERQPEPAQKNYRRALTGLLTSQLSVASKSVEPILLAGIGVPNGSVKIYIQSELRVVEVAIDDAGRWHYALDQALEKGDHNVFVQLFDRDGFESVAKKILSFQLEADFTPPVYSTALGFSEVFPNPSGRDAKGEWLELQNTSAESVALTGWQLRVNGKIFSLPADAQIVANSYALLIGNQFASAENFAMLHLKNFTLPNAGATLELLTPSNQIVARLIYPKLKEGVSFALSAQKFLLTALPTPGESNRIVALKNSSKKVAPKYRNGDLSSQILISEVLPNPVGSDTKTEWLELVNLGTTRVHLGNWRIDDAEGGSKPYVIPDSIYLRPGEYRIFPRSVTKLALNNTGLEKVRLFDFRGALISETEFRDLAESVALARDPEGEYRPTQILTPGKLNLFDTEKLLGKILFVGAEGFILRTESDREIFITFADNPASRLARAFFSVTDVANTWEIYVTRDASGYVLTEFKNSSALATSPLPQIFSLAEELTWLVTFAAILFGLVLFGMLRGRRGVGESVRR